MKNKRSFARIVLAIVLVLACVMSFAACDGVAIKSISVTTLPTKLVYQIGEKFDPTGGKLTAVLADDATLVVDINSAMCGTVDTSVAGKVEVKVGYLEKFTTFEITVLPAPVVVKEVKSISVSTLPTKGEYVVDEAFSALGGKITVAYANDTTENIDLTEAMCGSVNTATAGKVTVTVTYETKTATFDITVNKIAPTITTAPTASGKVTYGDALPAITGVAKDGDTVVAGVFALVAGQKLTVANKSYNYTFTPTNTTKYTTATGTATITVVAKALTITGVTAQYKSYDGTCDVILENGTLTGIVSPDVVTLQLGKGTAVNKNAGASVSVTYTPSLLGVDKDNYVISSQNDVTVVVAKRMVMITGVIATERPYDGTNNITISGGIIGDGMLSGDLLGVELGQGTSLYAECGHDTDNVVSYKNAKLTLADAGNYVIEEGLSTKPLAKITKREIAVVWDATSLPYTGAPIVPTASVATGVVNETIALTITGQQTTIGTGYNATAAMSVANTNYTLTNTTVVFAIVESDASIAEALAAAKVAAISNLDTAKAAYIQSNYNTSEWSTIIGYYNAAVTDINAVTVISNLPGNFVETFKTSANLVKTKVNSISVSTLPTKVVYVVDEAFSVAGGKITVTYAGNTTENINLTEAMCGTNNTATAGTITVTVTYETKTATFDITVNKIAPTIATAPTASGTVTYGDTLPTLTGEARDGNTVVAGVFALDTGQTLTVANKSYNYTFTPTNTAKYTTATGVATITVVAKSIAVVWDATSLPYTGAPIAPTASVDTGVVSDTIALTITGQQTAIGNNYTARAAMTVANANYTLTNTTVAFTIVESDVSKAEALAAAKATEINDLNTAKTAYKQSNYNTSEWNTIIGYYNAAVTDINAVTVISNLPGNFVTTFTTNANLVKTIDQEAATIYDFTLIDNGAAYSLKKKAGVTLSANLTIPSAYGGIPVTTIDYKAFNACNELTTVNIPNSVTSIGRQAFFNCSNIAKITVPNSVTSIGKWAFDGTAWIKGKSEGVLYVNNVAYVYVGTMPTNTSIELTAGTVSISPAAFDRCTGLVSIIIPGSVKNIGNDAFNGCNSLTTITMQNGVESIDVRAFNGCTALTSINLPASVTNIVDNPFMNCINLNTITVDSGNATYKSAGNCVIKSASKTLIIGCKSSVIPIDNSVTSIGTSAFDGCANLASITIPSNVTSIGDYAFQSCTGLTTIDIPNSVVTIGEKAFVICSSLSAVTIGSGVTSIGLDAFYNCSSLTSITVDPANTAYASYKGVLTNKAKTEIIATPQSMNSDIKKEAQYIVSVNAIGTVAVTPECLAKIVAAENAYLTLSANVKSDEAVMSAHATAVAARTEYDRLAAAGV